ncbi:MAG: S1/P1 nuclease [Bacteroidetes bacterium]|jgi:hypothetical protein|nr:S1/P1 nuclease [Bacteroidota bacterium]
MKQRFIFIVALALLPWSLIADDWGKNGHRAVGEIAEKYLSEKTKKAISELLDGHSLAFVSNYGDDIKSDRKYDKYQTWHYVNFPLDQRYEETPKESKGDIIQAIQTAIQVLKDKNSRREDKVFHLKMLVHFMGDLHQPLHIGQAEDRGGNRIQVRWFGQNSNLHTVWDSKMIDSYQMSYTELAANADKLSKKELDEIKKGTLMDWVYDVRILTKEVYESANDGDRLGYEYMYKYMNPLRNQLQKGGIRLAVVLNDIFDK